MALQNNYYRHVNKSMSRDLYKHQNFGFGLYTEQAAQLIRPGAEQDRMR